MQLGNDCTKHACKLTHLWNNWTFTPVIVQVAQFILFPSMRLRFRNFRKLCMGIFPDQCLIIKSFHMPLTCKPAWRK